MVVVGRRTILSLENVFYREDIDMAIFATKHVTISTSKKGIKVTAKKGKKKK